MPAPFEFDTSPLYRVGPQDDGAEDYADDDYEDSTPPAEPYGAAGAPQDTPQGGGGVGSEQVALMRESLAGAGATENAVSVAERFYSAVTRVGDVLGDPGRAIPKHNYAIGDRWNAADLPYITLFLNFAHGRGLAQPEVDAVLTWYRANEQAFYRGDFAAARAPARGGDVGAELRRIEAYMRTNRAEYFRSPSMQARYRQLLARRGGR